MRQIFEIGGLDAAGVLIAFGIGAIAMGERPLDRAVGARAGEDRRLARNDAQDHRRRGEGGRPCRRPSRCRRETSPASPSTTATARAALPATCAIHALDATGGLTYSKMPRFATDDGKGTNDAAAAPQGPTGKPLDNPARNIWISETAVSTATVLCVAHRGAAWLWRRAIGARFCTGWVRIGHRRRRRCLAEPQKVAHCRHS